MSLQLSEGMKFGAPLARAAVDGSRSSASRSTLPFIDHASAPSRIIFAAPHFLIPKGTL